MRGQKHVIFYHMKGVFYVICKAIWIKEIKHANCSFIIMQKDGHLWQPMIFLTISHLFTKNMKNDIHLLKSASFPV